MPGISREVLVRILSDTAGGERVVRLMDNLEKRTNRTNEIFDNLNNNTARLHSGWGELNKSGKSFLGIIDQMSPRLGTLAMRFDSVARAAIAAKSKMFGFLGGLTIGGMAAGGRVYGEGMDFQATLDDSLQRIASEIRRQGEGFGSARSRANQLSKWALQFKVKTPYALDDIMEALSGYSILYRGNTSMAQRGVKAAALLATKNPNQGMRGAAISIQEAESGYLLSAVRRFNLPKNLLQANYKRAGGPGKSGSGLAAIEETLKQIGVTDEMMFRTNETGRGLTRQIQALQKLAFGEAMKGVYQARTQYLKFVRDRLRLMMSERSTANQLLQLSSNLMGKLSGLYFKALEFPLLSADKVLAWLKNMSRALDPFLANLRQFGKGVYQGFVVPIKAMFATLGLTGRGFNFLMQISTLLGGRLGQAVLAPMYAGQPLSRIAGTAVGGYLAARLGIAAPGLARKGIRALRGGFGGGGVMPPSGLPVMGLGPAGAHFAGTGSRDELIGRLFQMAVAEFQRAVEEFRLTIAFMHTGGAGGATANPLAMGIPLFGRLRGTRLGQRHAGILDRIETPILNLQERAMRVSRFIAVADLYKRQIEGSFGMRMIYSGLANPKIGGRIPAPLMNPLAGYFNEIHGQRGVAQTGALLGAAGLNRLAGIKGMPDVLSRLLAQGAGYLERYAAVKPEADKRVFVVVDDLGAAAKQTLGEIFSRMSQGSTLGGSLREQVIKDFGLANVAEEIARIKGFITRATDGGLTGNRANLGGVSGTPWAQRIWETIGRRGAVGGLDPELNPEVLAGEGHRARLPTFNFDKSRFAKMGESLSGFASRAGTWANAIPVWGKVAAAGTVLAAAGLAYRHRQYRQQMAAYGPMGLGSSGANPYLAAALGRTKRAALLGLGITAATSTIGGIAASKGAGFLVKELTGQSMVQVMARVLPAIVPMAMPLLLGATAVGVITSLARKVLGYFGGSAGLNYGFRRMVNPATGAAMGKVGGHYLGGIAGAVPGAMLGRKVGGGALKWLLAPLVKRYPLLGLALEGIGAFGGGVLGYKGGAGAGEKVGGFVGGAGTKLLTTLAIALGSGALGRFVGRGIGGGRGALVGNLVSMVAGAAGSSFAGSEYNPLLGALLGMPGIAGLFGRGAKGIGNTLLRMGTRGRLRGDIIGSWLGKAGSLGRSAAGSLGKSSMWGRIKGALGNLGDIGAELAGNIGSRNAADPFARRAGRGVANLLGRLGGLGRSVGTNGGILGRITGTLGRYIENSRRMGIVANPRMFNATTRMSETIVAGFNKSAIAKYLASFIGLFTRFFPRLGALIPAIARFAGPVAAVASAGWSLGRLIGAKTGLDNTLTNFFADRLPGTWLGNRLGFARPVQPAQRTVAVGPKLPRRNIMEVLGATNINSYPDQRYSQSDLQTIKKQNGGTLPSWAMLGHNGYDLRLGKKGVADTVVNPFQSGTQVMGFNKTLGGGGYDIQVKTPGGRAFTMRHVNTRGLSFNKGDKLAYGQKLGVEALAGSGYHLHMEANGVNSRNAQALQQYFAAEGLDFGNNSKSGTPNISVPVNVQVNTGSNPQQIQAQVRAEVVANADKIATQVVKQIEQGKR